MLKGQAVFFDGLQHAATKAHFAVHHGLFHRQHAEAQTASDTGDDVGIFLVHRAMGDHGATGIGVVGVTDVGGDTGTMHREHAILVQNASAHVGKLAQLAVGDVADGAGIRHDAGIRHQKAAYIGPVFIQLRIGSTSHDGTGDIATATGEGFHLAASNAAVETGNDGTIHMLEGRSHHGVGQLAVKGAILGEEHQLLGIKEGVAQIVSQQETIEVFAAAGHVVLGHAQLDFLLQRIQMLGNVDIQLQFLSDFQIALADLLEHRAEVLAALVGTVGAVEQVGNLFVLVKPAARGAGDNIATALILFDDRANLAELARIRKRTAAKLCNDLSHSSIPSRRFEGTCDPSQILILSHTLL